ncbi:TPA: hypothetical protein DGT35_00080 [Patescibacteria group bacterium]|nr:hypothetical protein [Patescibacteria group bacterium]|tara:strand:- start:680 stop:2029 length:1350 start_codon:yes stop_codon:yes gene_type:complete
MKKVFIIIILLVLSTPIAFGQGAMESALALDEVEERVGTRNDLMTSIDRTTDTNRMSHLSGSKLTTRIRRDAQEMKKALYDPYVDVDEVKTYQILRGTSSNYRTRLAEEYLRITGNRFQSDLLRLGNDNGHDVLRGKLLFKQGTLYPEDRIVLGSDGRGTNERLFFDEVMSMSLYPEDKARLNDRWAEKYGSSGIFKARANGGESSVLTYFYSEESDESYRSTLQALWEGKGGFQDNHAALTASWLGINPAELDRAAARTYAERVVDEQMNRGETRNDAVMRIYNEKLAFIRTGMGSLQVTGSGELECGPDGLGYKLCVPILGKEKVENIGGYIVLIYQFALAISGILAFIMITYGGIRWTVSGGNVSKISEAKEIITNAIFGLILLAIATSILYIIDPSILSIRVDKSTFTVRAPNYKAPVKPIPIPDPDRLPSAPLIIIDPGESNNE